MSDERLFVIVQGRDGESIYNTVPCCTGEVTLSTSQHYDHTIIDLLLNGLCMIHQRAPINVLYVHLPRDPQDQAKPVVTG